MFRAGTVRVLMMIFCRGFGLEKESMRWDEMRAKMKRKEEKRRGVQIERNEGGKGGKG